MQLAKRIPPLMKIPAVRGMLLPVLLGILAVPVVLTGLIVLIVKAVRRRRRLQSAPVLTEDPFFAA